MKYTEQPFYKIARHLAVLAVETWADRQYTDINRSFCADILLQFVGGTPESVKQLVSDLACKSYAGFDNTLILYIKDTIPEALED